MKLACLIALLFLVFLLGCDSNKNEGSPSSTMPDKITLSFTPLEMNELQMGEVASDWKYIKSIAFGRIEDSEAALDIYEIKASSENLTNQINGVLKFKDNQFILSNLPSSLIEGDGNVCPQVCLFQRYFSNQNSFELIGSVDASLNGPGIKEYLIYDAANSKIVSIDLWGEPSFIDLDTDGNDEFIVEFQGLHLSWPDLSIIRTTKNGQLEISTSVFNSIQKNQGDFAILINENVPPIIRFSNVQSETEPFYNYTYNDGILVRNN